MAQAVKSGRLCGLIATLLSVISIAAAPATTGSLYEVRVDAGLSYQEVVDSLEVAAQSRNFVKAATFPMAKTLKDRGQETPNVLEVWAYCNLTLGSQIFTHHPEFAAFAPCRIAIYERAGQLYLGMSRPTQDLKAIRNPHPQAIQAAQKIEETMVWMIEQARHGRF